MTNKKCCIKDCPSEEGKEEFHGTFHRFPQTNPENQEKWIKGKRQFRNNLNSLIFLLFQHVK